MACIPAPACRAALAEASSLWPGRSTASDGICPSAEHSRRNPTSDHEKGEAYDLTDDPGAGCDCGRLTRLLVAKRDPRVKYIIHDRMIYGPGSGGGWAGKPYTGSNPHTSHMHVSIQPGARNDVAPWFGGDPGTILSLDDPSGTSPSEAPAAGFGLGSAIPGVSEIQAIGRAAGFLADPDNWRRVALYAGGLVLAGLALALVIADSRAGRTVTNAVVQARTAGAVDLDGPA